VKHVNIPANTSSVKVASLAGYDSHELGPNEGNATYDGATIAAKAICRISGPMNGHVVARVIHIDTPSFGPVIDLTAVGLVSESALDWVSISPLGGYVVAEGDFGDGHEDTRKVFDASSGTLLHTWNDYRGQHLDLGVDNAGHEVMVHPTGEAPYTHHTIMRRLDTGAPTEIDSGQTVSYNWHIGARSPNLPLAVVTQNDSDGHDWDGRIVTVALNAANAVAKVCRHFCLNTDYDSAPKACASPSGTRIFFASNWSTSSNRPMQGYIVSGW
jgi:hypothetical protein